MWYSINSSEEFIYSDDTTLAFQHSDSVFEMGSDLWND